jgi:Zn-dependent peptidase ImmA (M78 family)
VLQGIDDVLHYAAFLRHEAGISDEPPVDLEPIFEHYGMPPPIYASLPGQQAILLNDETGLVLINEDDPATRQRFSQAHELIERLFSAHEESLHAGSPGVRFQDRVKEDLCEQGAAALLLPRSSFLPRLAGLGISLQAASALANMYQASLLATLFQMVRYGPGAHALVVWRYALKPKQVQDLPAPEQIPLLDADLVPSPQRELRVWWATRTKGLTSWFFPKHKSIPRESLIYQAYDTGLSQAGDEFVNLGKLRGTFHIEARRIQIGDELCVVSLLHVPGDKHCRHGESPKS